MRMEDNALEMSIREAENALRRRRSAAILQPGAIGDCILTLPLAKYVKEALDLGSMEMIGCADYLSIFPGRTCVDRIRSMNSVELHRLFVDKSKFDVRDKDPLIDFFSEYSWILTFLGEKGSDFEDNLIFTVHCSHNAEIMTLELKQTENKSHISDFYKEQFIEESKDILQLQKFDLDDIFIKFTSADNKRGLEILGKNEISEDEKIIIMHPGSGGLHKCWHIDNFISVARELSRNGFEVIFLIGPAEQERFEEEKIQKMRCAAKCLENLSLEEVLCVLSCSSGFIGNDSGITHLSAASGIKTFVIFGPTDPCVYKPLGPRVTVIQDQSKSFSTDLSAKIQNQLLELII
jgi:hypothetical protein